MCHDPLLEPPKDLEATLGGARLYSGEFRSVTTTGIKHNSTSLPVPLLSHLFAQLLKDYHSGYTSVTIRPWSH